MDTSHPSRPSLLSLLQKEKRKNTKEKRRLFLLVFPSPPLKPPPSFKKRGRRKLQNPSFPFHFLTKTPSFTTPHCLFSGSTTTIPIFFLSSSTQTVILPLPLHLIPKSSPALLTTTTLWNSPRKPHLSTHTLHNRPPSPRTRRHPFTVAASPTNFLCSSYTTTKLKCNPYYSPTNFRPDSCLVCDSRKRLCCQNINVAILIFNSMTIRMSRLYRFDASNDDMLMLCSTMVNFLTCISYYNFLTCLSVSIFDLSSSRYGWISITL